MKRKLTGLTIAAALVLGACGGNEAPIGSQSEETIATERPTADRAGNAIAIPYEATRIVSLAPSITQVLESLGALDRVVAVDTWTPTVVEGLDGLPQLDIVAPDMEALLALEPDLVLATGISFGMDETIFDTLMAAGVPVAHIPTSISVADILLDNQFIADAVGLSAAGQALNLEMEAKIEAIRAIGQTIEAPKRVYFEISPAPENFSFGSGTFLQELLDIINAENIFASEEGWLPVSEEAVVAANPDVILTNVNFLPDPVGEIMERTAWANVAAVKNGAVFAVDNMATSAPNHLVVNGLLEMALAVYPEAFADLGR